MARIGLVSAALFLGLYYAGNSKSHAAGSFKTTQTGPKPIWNETHLDRLKKDLLMNYDKFTRPEHHTNITKIKIGMSVLNLETDEPKSTMTVESWLRLEWTDSKLKWNESDYGGLSAIRIADHEVWQPDIYLFNSAAGGEQISRLGNRNVLVYPNGIVLWVPPIKLTALCEFNLRHWPFDTQHCYLKLASWVYSSTEVKLNIYNKSTIELETTVSGSPWNINGTVELQSRVYACCKETYESAVFNFTLSRKSSPYNAIIVTPAVVTTFLILIQFWLPPHAGERIILNSFTATILDFFLIYFNRQVTAAGSNVPLIVLYYSSSLYIVGFTMVGAIASYLLCNIQKTKPLPWIVKRLLQGQFGRWVLLEQYSDEIFAPIHKESVEEMKDHQVSDFDSKSDNQQTLEDLIQQQWVMLAVAIDRMLFLVYSFVFVILAITFFQ